MAKTELVPREEHYVPPDSKLAIAEEKLADAQHDFGESFFRIGMIFTEIRDKQYWKDGEYASFDHYCDHRQPLGYKRSAVKQFILAAAIRPLLPSLDDAAIRGVAWTEWAVRPLTHKDFQPSDVRRIGKKILAQVKKQKKLTAAMVKEICDKERGVERKKAKKMKQALKDASLESNLQKCIADLQTWLVALQMYDEEAWSEVEETNPQLIAGVIRELDLFASYMKE